MPIQSLKAGGPVRGWASSPGAAFIGLLGLVLWFGRGQEVWALDFPIDDRYFLMRSESMTLLGSHLAPIKEPLYPLFLRLARWSTLRLRTFEAGAYAGALFALWLQLGRLSRSTAVAWLTVLPLALFAYQHPVLNRVTYDALQLILTPLTFAAAIHLYRRRAGPASLALNGALVGLHGLNRPEGLLFILPPLTVLAVLLWQEHGRGAAARAWAFVKQAALLAAIPLLLLQGLSALNARVFGFWAATSIQSPHFQACLRDLMAIQGPPCGVSRYVPVTREALGLAYGASPAFARAKPCFDRNLDGLGWSSAWYRERELQQGDLAGGQFQWALLEAGASVAGEGTREQDAYFMRVAQELDAAFSSGQLTRRPVLATFLGPAYAPWRPAFLRSLVLGGKGMLGMVSTPLPETHAGAEPPQVDQDFNRLALRDASLVPLRDGLAAPGPPPGLGAQKLVTKLVFGAMAGFIPLALALFLAGAMMARGEGRAPWAGDLGMLWAVGAPALALAAARLWLFASIDSCMYWGFEPRYMAAGAFAMWFFAAFTVALGVRRLALRPRGWA
jgi:hypothetical protein